MSGDLWTAWKSKTPESNKSVHKNGSEDWKVTLVDTGENTMTGGRLKRARQYIGNETFTLTYGNGVSDIYIKKLIEFHKKQKTLATVTAVQPPGRFGIFNLEEGATKVTSFREKDVQDTGWINAGFYVLEPEIFDFIKEGDATVWEQSPMRGVIALFPWHAQSGIGNRRGHVSRVSGQREWGWQEGVRLVK